VISSAAIVAGFALQSFDTFLRNDGNHDKTSHRVAHHKPKIALSNNPSSRIADKWVQNSVCFASACMAVLPRASPTFRFALEGMGMTTNGTQAKMIRGTLCSGAFLGPQVRSGFEGHVGSQ